MKTALRNHFIQASREFNTFEKNVPAPCIRKSIFSSRSVQGKISIAACGFYELFWNGQRITKGILAPYISNADQYIYMDEYTVDLDEGENVVSLLLGNGLFNNPGGYIWDFEKAACRAAPMVSLCLSFPDENNKETLLFSDETFKTMPSAILSDDYRFGVTCDRNREIPHWREKGFDDANWQPVFFVQPPRGEIRLSEAEPVVSHEEIQPVRIFPDGEGGYIYDFGQSNAGLCRLKIRGEKNQKIVLRYGDQLRDGKINLENVWFVRDFWQRDRELVHKDVYICRGDAEETYTPPFEYHGFRYVGVKGISEKQAEKELLTYVVCHSDLKDRGSFSCSDPILNQLQEMTRRSDLSNFYYFPTDCPQREKNGWTGDAALSAEQMLLNFQPEKSYREWMFNIRRSQDENGSLPGIVPTYGWGSSWGNGPAWDIVLVNLPYFTYKYRGETSLISENAHAFMNYLDYLASRMDEKGLVHFGLGDWCQVGDVPPAAPLEVTDTMTAMDIAQKMAFLLDVVHQPLQSNFAKNLADHFKQAIRTHLIDFSSMTVLGNCQTSQAMGLFYHLFTKEEEPAAFKKLLSLIHEKDDHMDVGILGGRVIFHVLSQFGCTDLALKMIARPDYPSYGNWISRGATTLWENFHPDSVQSMNHHFWGDISSWFIQNLAGIQLNPSGKNVHELLLKPQFPQKLTKARASHLSPDGKIVSFWKKEDKKIIWEIQFPDGIKGKAVLPENTVFEDGQNEKEIFSGTYILHFL